VGSIRSLLVTHDVWEAGTSRSPTLILNVVIPAVRVSGQPSSPAAGSSLASDVCSALAAAAVRFWLVAG